MENTERSESLAKIKEAEERARLALKAANLGSFEVNLQINQAITSARFDEIFGVDHSTEHTTYVSALHPDDLGIREEAYQRAYKTGLLEYEARVIRKEDTIRWIRVWGNIYFDEQSIPQKILGVIQDITEQKEFAEELSKQVKERTLALEEKNRELERSNSNLEEFAHAASHDLKEPIRKIHFFTNRLKEQLTSTLTEAEISTFDRIEKSTERMSSLIDDLLLYSQVSQRPIDKEEIDLTQKLGRILDDLELNIQEKNAKITLIDLPVVCGYRRQLQQLFQNLLTNSMKYSKQHVPPEIIIRGRKVKGAGEGLGTDVEYYQIEVQDNGIGFDQAYADKIFQMFTRLHGKTEYKGTGIGLAIVKKVVDNHQGFITVESEPGKGTTFRVYFPVE